MSLPTFVSIEPFAVGKTVTLGEDEAQHMRVRRLELGSRIALVDGQGLRGEGALVRLAKRHAAVTVESTTIESPPLPVHLILPVADKDRMLWLAEKCAELALTSWRPVTFRRSRSVAPRGEGPMFTQKVAARMASALEQSGGAWLPTLYPAAKLDRAIAASAPGARLVLDPAGEPIVRVVDRITSKVDEPPAITLVVGPEGGLDEDELRELTNAHFVPVAFGGTILRFETAAVSALAVARAALDASGSNGSVPRPASGSSGEGND